MLIVHLMCEGSTASQGDAWCTAGSQVCLFNETTVWTLLTLSSWKCYRVCFAPKYKLVTLVKGYSHHLPSKCSIMSLSSAIPMRNVTLAQGGGPLNFDPLHLYVSGKNDSVWEFIKGQFSLQLLSWVYFTPRYPIKGKGNWPQASFLLSSAQKSITAQRELLWLFSQWTHFHPDSLFWSWEIRCECALFCFDTSHFQQNWDNLKESYTSERRWVAWELFHQHVYSVLIALSSAHKSMFCCLTPWSHAWVTAVKWWHAARDRESSSAPGKGFSGQVKSNSPGETIKIKIEKLASSKCVLHGARSCKSEDQKSVAFGFHPCSSKTTGEKGYLWAGTGKKERRVWGLGDWPQAFALGLE